MLWNDVCFALDCFAFFVRTLFVLAFSTLFTWILIFWNDDEESYFKRWIGVLAFVGVALGQGLTALVFRTWWPEHTGKSLITIWMMITAYATWKMILEPFCFRVSQEFSHMAGFELSDYGAAILTVPWRWAVESIRRPINPMSQAIKQDESDPTGF